MLTDPILLLQIVYCGLFIGFFVFYPPQVGGRKMLINFDLDKFTLNNRGSKAFVKMLVSWSKDNTVSNHIIPC